MVHVSKLGKSLRLACASVAVAALLTACSSKQERAQAHYERGLELLHDGEVAKAGLEFRNALSLKLNTSPSSTLNLVPYVVNSQTIFVAGTDSNHVIAGTISVQNP